MSKMKVNIPLFTGRNKTFLVKFSTKVKTAVMPIVKSDINKIDKANFFLSVSFVTLILFPNCNKVNILSLFITTFYPFLQF